MYKAKLLTLVVIAGGALVSSHANTLQPVANLSVFTDRVQPVTHGSSGVPPNGYFPQSDPTRTSYSHTVSDPWDHDEHQDRREKEQATYQSNTSVNKNKSLPVCNTDCYSDGSQIGHSIAESSGHADTQNLKVGAYSRAHNFGNAMGSLADTEASVTTMFRVTSSNSGLPDGTVVDLNWLYHLEGETKVAGRTFPDTTDVIADVTSNALIRSLYSSGEGYDILAEVGFDLNLRLTSELPSPGSTQDTAFLDGRQSWWAGNNTGFAHSDSEEYDRWYDGSSNDISRTVSVDSKTGFFGLDYVPFQAVVGEWMVLEFDLNLFSSVSDGASPFGPMGYGSTYNDYFNTLANSFQFGGASQGLGLQLEFAGATTPTATPEPGTICIAGLGLIAIGVVARRRVKVG